MQVANRNWIGSGMKSSRESRKAAEEASLRSEVKLSGKRTGDRPRSGFCMHRGQKDDDLFLIVFFCTGIIMTEYIIITNNPFVKEKLLNKRPVCYKPVDYEAILRYVKALILEGHRLLSHPLAGSVKPGETPYRSIMISKKAEAQADRDSLRLIDAALDAAGKFCYRPVGSAVEKDLQLIDWTLIQSALASADACS